MFISFRLCASISGDLPLFPTNCHVIVVSTYIFFTALYIYCYICVPYWFYIFAYIMIQWLIIYYNIVYNIWLNAWRQFTHRTLRHLWTGQGNYWPITYLQFTYVRLSGIRRTASGHCEYIKVYSKGTHRPPPSPQLFTICLIPLPVLLREAKQGNKLARNQCVKHGRLEATWEESLAHKARIYPEGIRMRSGL